MARPPVRSSAGIGQGPNPAFPPRDPATVGSASGGSWGAAPQFTAGMTFGEYGQSGLRQFSGWVREEFLPQLVGRQMARVYREMADNNATIGAIIFAIKSTMRKVQWRAEPKSDSPDARQAAEFVEGLMHDMSHTWDDLVDENLSMLHFGFAPHEIVYKRRLGTRPGPDPDRPRHDLPRSQFDDGLIGWRRIPIRGQETVLKWFFDENGGVKGMTQQPWVGTIVDLPIEKMLLFRPSVHKGNPEGRSILRSAWRSYHFTKRIEEQEAILFERLNGFPVVRVPNALIEQAKAGDSNAAAALQSFKDIATNLRVNEQMGIVLSSQTYEGAQGAPSQVYQYDIQLVAPEGRRVGVTSNDVLDRYNTQMMTCVMADFLRLGHTARGTQALANNKVDMFFQAVEGYLNSNAAIYNRHALPRLWALNGFDDELMPEITPDMAQRVDLDVLSNYILRLAQAGMPLFPNEELQQYILDAAGLPDVLDPLAMDAAGLGQDQIQAQTEHDIADHEAGTEAAKNPPPPGQQQPNGGAANLNKMLLASLARRVERMQGPRFGITTKRKDRPRVARIARYQNEIAKAKDSVEVSVPMLIRLLEWAREEADSDIPLHEVAERLAQAGTAEMADYERVVGSLPPTDKKKLNGHGTPAAG